MMKFWPGVANDWVFWAWSFWKHFSFTRTKKTWRNEERITWCSIWAFLVFRGFHVKTRLVLSLFLQFPIIMVEGQRSDAALWIVLRCILRTRAAESTNFKWSPTTTWKYRPRIQLRLRFVSCLTTGIPSSKSNMMQPFSWFLFWLYINGWYGNTALVRVNFGCSQQWLLLIFLDRLAYISVWICWHRWTTIATTLKLSPMSFIRQNFITKWRFNPHPCRGEGGGWCTITSFSEVGDLC